MMHYETHASGFLPQPMLTRHLLHRVAGLALLLPAVAFASGWSSRPFAELAVYPEFRAAAHVEALNQSRIASEVAGRIASLAVRVGEGVEAGAELARVDASDYRIAVDRAQAQVGLVESRLHLAEAQLQQSRALAARGYISEDGLRIKRTELEVLKSELAAARHGLAAARLPLQRTVIRAPYAGVVRERLASVGDLAVPGTPLLVLASTTGTEIHARIAAAQIDGLKAAKAWTLHIGERTHALQLERVLAVVDAAGQTQAAVFSAPAELAPGRAGEVRWRTVVPHLPGEYVVRYGGQLGVWLERDGKAIFEALPDAAVGRAVPVSWSLATRVIDEGRFGLGVVPAAEAAQ
jgi:RND family efflux transporter MFP subunit